VAAGAPVDPGIEDVEDKADGIGAVTDVEGAAVADGIGTAVLRRDERVAFSARQRSENKQQEWKAKG